MTLCKKRMQHRLLKSLLPKDDADERDSIIEGLICINCNKYEGYSQIKGWKFDIVNVTESDMKGYKGNVDARSIVAGLSTTCSQKIHNQLIGMEKMHKDNKYVLFVDDDVRMHPGSIGVLTIEMEKDPDIFIQTRYPLDIPSGSLGSYYIYEYHMVPIQPDNISCGFYALRCIQKIIGDKTGAPIEKISGFARNTYRKDQIDVIRAEWVDEATPYIKAYVPNMQNVPFAHFIKLYQVLRMIIFN